MANLLILIETCRGNQIAKNCLPFWKIFLFVLE